MIEWWWLVVAFGVGCLVTALVSGLALWVFSGSFMESWDRAWGYR